MLMALTTRVALFVLSAIFLVESAPTKPNIGEKSDRERLTCLLLYTVYIVTDDQDVKLGSLDLQSSVQSMLIERGKTFKNAFVSTPVCCPSRSRLMYLYITHFPVKHIQSQYSTIALFISHFITPHSMMLTNAKVLLLCVKLVSYFLFRLSHHNFSFSLRSSILTGKYVHNHRTYENSVASGCNAPSWRQLNEQHTIGAYLTTAGYHTGFFGKQHTRLHVHLI